MDTLRGIAIALVLAWHAVEIPAQNGREIPESIMVFNNFFTPFRMPILMFLSGMLLGKSMQKSNKSYFFGKARSLVWPYFIWVTISIAIFGNVKDLINIASWIGNGYLWFVFYVTIYYISAKLVVLLNATVALTTFFVLLLIFQDHSIYKFIYFAIFFFLGHWLPKSKLYIRIIGSKALTYASAIVGCLLGILSSAKPEVTDINPLFIPWVLVGIMGIIGIASRIPTTAFSRWISFLGEHSLIFYVVHVPANIVFQYLLNKILHIPTTTLAIVLFVSSVLIGIALSLVRKKRLVSWLFIWPFQGLTKDNLRLSRNRK